MKLRDDVFISTTFDKNNDFNNTIKTCFDNDFLNLELGSTHEYKNYIKEIVRKYPFRYITHNFFPPKKNNLILNIASLNEKLRSESIDHIKFCIKFAKDIGAELYTFHPGFLHDPSGTSNFGRNYDFKWNKIKNSNLKQSFKNMLTSLVTILEYSNKIKMKTAIETEGSYFNSDKVLLQTPYDFKRIYSHFGDGVLNFNLNLGHLNLASRFHKFKKKDLIDLIYNDVVALEISHNNGLIDQHKSLTDTSPCLDHIGRFKSKKILKILEFRNTEVTEIKKSIRILNSKLK